MAQRFENMHFVDQHIIEKKTHMAENVAHQAYQPSSGPRGRRQKAKITKQYQTYTIQEHKVTTTNININAKYQQ